MKYKVGDKVRIKTNGYDTKFIDKLGKTKIIHLEFLPEMKIYCGYIAIIIEVKQDMNLYRIDLDNHRFMWCDEMFDETFGFKQLAIGEVFDFEGHKLKVEEGINDSCIGCFFDKCKFDNGCNCGILLNKGVIPECIISNRVDKNSVIFKEIEDNYIFEELPIGEVFDFKGHKLRVEKDVHGSCAGCFMLKNYRIENCCAQLFQDRLRPRCGSMRKDRTGVIFKEIENMEKRKVELDIETAKKWYNENDNSLRTIALQAYTEDELKPNELPNTWEEFCKNYHNCEEDSCIDSFSNIVTYSNNHERSSLVDRNLLPNKKYAEGILALCQLTQLRDCYRQGWVPDWSNCVEIKYSIVLQYTKITSIGKWNVQSFLSFQTSEICDKFLNNFKDLIELAKEYI